MEQQLRTEINQLIGKLPESKLQPVLAYLKEIEKSSKENNDLMTHLDKIFEEDAGLLKQSSTMINKKIKALKLTIIILSVIIFPTNQIFGINYETGDSLNVYAKNGLNIRNKASLDGEKIRLIPFGSKVRIIDTKNFEFRDTFERVPGNWIEISYLGINGFVFDGYLSKLTIPKLSQKKKHLISDLASYIKANYKKKFEVSTHEPCNDPVGKECNHGQFITIYGENIVHTVAYSWESETNDFHFRDTRFSEIINLLLLFIDEQNPLFQTLNKKVNTGFDHRREIKHQKEGINFILIWDKKDCLIKLDSWV